MSTQTNVPKRHYNKIPRTQLKLLPVDVTTQLILKKRKEKKIIIKSDSFNTHLWKI